MTYKLFISHSEEDESLARIFKIVATDAGVIPYLFEDDTQPGKSLIDKIEKRINECDCMLALLTKNSKNKTWVQQEMAYAKAKGKDVIPIIEPGLEFNLGILQGIEYIDISDQRAIEKFNYDLRKRKEGKESKEIETGLMFIGIFLFLAYLYFRRSS